MGRFVSESIRPTNTSTSALSQSDATMRVGMVERTGALGNTVGAEEWADEGGVAYRQLIRAFAREIISYGVLIWRTWKRRTYSHHVTILFMQRFDVLVLEATDTDDTEVELGYLATYRTGVAGEGMEG